jgi:CheY-like chemotaxis protein
VVLVVEDEDAVRRYATGLLAELGFTVVSAADGTQALEVVRARGAELVLILLDLTLPGLGGEAVLDEIERVGTKVPVVMCSGSDPHTVRRLFAGHRVAGYLAKPYGLEQMRTTLHAALT